MAASSSSHTRSRPNSYSQANHISNNPSISLQLTSALSHPLPSPYSITEAYEARLRTMKNGALFVAGLQKISRFFGICALTWATVVLLGGFASALKPLDFYLVSILLLLEALRLSTTQVFSKLLSKTLFREHHRPEQFKFKDLQYFWARRLDLLGQCSSCLVAIVGLVLAAVRFHITGHHGFTETDKSDQSPDQSQSNLSPALYTFYMLVILNSATAIASAFCRLFFRQFLGPSSDDSLMCYHDEVYRTAMNVGMPEADDIDIFEFAFKKLASDHMRSIRPLTIKARNRDLIKYIYNSPNGVGVTCEHLTSSDVWKQVAAANLPGFWEGESRIERQVALFWALRGKLYGAGKVAEAAANSIQCLSKAWARQETIGERHPFLISDPSKSNRVNVVDTLIDLLLHPIRSSLLFQLRALEGCCRSRPVLKHIYDQSRREHHVLWQDLQNLIAPNNDGEHHAPLSMPEELCLKLQKIVGDPPRNSVPRQTTKMYAANTLHALLRFGGELAGNVKESLQGMVQEHIDPAKFMGNGEYVWQDEKDMLNTLRLSLGLARYEHWDRVRIVGPHGLDEPSTTHLCKC